MSTKKRHLDFDTSVLDAHLEAAFVDARSDTKVEWTQDLMCPPPEPTRPVPTVAQLVEFYRTPGVWAGSSVEPLHIRQSTPCEPVVDEEAQTITTTEQIVTTRRIPPSRGWSPRECFDVCVAYIDRYDGPHVLASLEHRFRDCMLYLTHVATEDTIVLANLAELCYWPQRLHALLMRPAVVHWSPAFEINHRVYDVIDGDLWYDEHVLDYLPMPVVCHLLAYDTERGVNQRADMRHLARRYSNWRHEQWLCVSRWLVDRTCNVVANLIGQFVTAAVTPKTPMRGKWATREWLKQQQQQQRPNKRYKF